MLTNKSKPQKSVTSATCIATTWLPATRPAGLKQAACPGWVLQEAMADRTTHGRQKAKEVQMNPHILGRNHDHSDLIWPMTTV